MSYFLVVHEPGKPERPHEVDAEELVLGSDPSVDLVAKSAALTARQGAFRLDDRGLFYVPFASVADSTVLSRGGKSRPLDPEAARDGVRLAHADCLLFGSGAGQVKIEILEGEPCEALSIPSPSSVTETESAGKVLASRSIRTVELLDVRIRERDTGAMAILYRMVRPLRLNRSLGEVASLTAEEILRSFPETTHVTLFLADEDEPAALKPAFMLHRRSPSPESSGDGKHIVSRSLLERVVREQTAILVLDASGSFAGSESVALGQIRSCVCVPLFTRGLLLGVLQVDSRRRVEAFDERDLEILTVFGDHLAAVIENALLQEKLRLAEAVLRRENDSLRRSISEGGRAPLLIGDSAKMADVRRQIELAAGQAGARLPLMICGETGTGKDLVARFAHALGSRRDGPFIAENCGAIPTTLAASELFGHARGAFTGAVAAKAGRFAAASGGTLFLDEVADLPLDVQVMLLRVVEDGKIRPVGASVPLAVDVRIIAATNKNLEREVAEGRFREDLFYRLNLMRVDLPPLRERREDIPALARHFLGEFRAKTGEDVSDFEPAALAALEAFGWPGNVRQLEGEVWKAAIHSGGAKEITPAALSPAIRGGPAAAAPPGLPGEPDSSLAEAVETVERRMIEETLRRFDHNITKTADSLGLSRPGLRQKMERYGISKGVG